MKIHLVVLIVCLAAGGVLGGPVDQYRAYYVAQSGGVPSEKKLDAIAYSGGEGDGGVYWNSRVMELPRPTESMLPDEAASGVILTEYAFGKEAARQAAKPQALKDAEKAAIAFLKSEGVETQDTEAVEPPAESGGPKKEKPSAGSAAKENKKPSKEDLNTLSKDWGKLPEAQANEKSATYERLLRAVVRNGGTEADMYDHPE